MLDCLRAELTTMWPLSRPNGMDGISILPHQYSLVPAILPPFKAMSSLISNGLFSSGTSESRERNAWLQVCHVIRESTRFHIVRFSTRFQLQTVTTGN